MRIGIIREGKTPPDSRVPLVPSQAHNADQRVGLELVVQPSPIRCFSDEEYRRAGVGLSEDLSGCDVLLGVKEVPIGQLIEGKTYFFFSHTHKEQAYNRDLLRAVLAKNIRLIDYELLADEQGKRVIAFGRFAGMVGAHHGLRAYGVRTGGYALAQMRDFRDYAAARAVYAKTDFGAVRVVVTGTGRVGKGAAEVLADAGLRRVTNAEFLAGEGAGEAVFTAVSVERYVRAKDGKPFRRGKFFDRPEAFENALTPYLAQADVFVNGVFWDPRAPSFFALDELAGPSFRVSVIADVTCDIAPVTSVPTTIRSSTIADPYFGIDRRSHRETDPWAAGSVTMMTVDNLPNEMPRDASRSFGTMFTKYVLPELTKPDSAVLDRATLASGGTLTERYAYLEAYAGV